MLTRRDMLKLVAAGGAAASAGVLTSCTGGVPSSKSTGGSGGGGEVDVELKVADWPFTPMPTAQDQAKDPARKAYAETLQAWMDKNPGVTIKSIKLDIWNQEALKTAITGGTAPATFPGNVLGGWNSAATRSAFVQGLAADVTSLVEKYSVGDKLASYARPIWETWKVNDKYYGAPDWFGAGNGIYYRRDLIKDLGLKEPTPGWTWSDFRELAKGLTKGNRKGVAFQAHGINWWLGADGFADVTQIPDPSSSWNWRWDYTSMADTWARDVEGFRAMAYQDGSVLSDVSFADGDVNNAFAQGRAAMCGNNTGWFTANPNTANTPGALAKKLGKPIEEVVGWIQHPVGDYGRFGNTAAFMTLLSFAPDLSAEALDKAFSLHNHLVLGEGYDQQKKGIWSATKDLQQVFGDPAPLNGRLKIDGIPGGIEDAWGESFPKAVAEASAIPLLPDRGNYFPAEDKTGPAETPVEDARSRWSFERGKVDIRADLSKVEQNRNKQAKSFTSSVSDDEFVKSAKAYYEACQKFWQEHAPEYATQVYDAWYEKNVVPALG